jgi:predicted NUDIX family NTP pyrophosphohydrolase
MAKKHSAGLLMYRIRQGQLEVFLVHPGGPFFRKKDEGVWSIPKGEIEPGEDPLDTACREFEEETGLKPEGPFIPLGEIKQKGGKVVSAWAFVGDWDSSRPLRSSEFELEWPPRSGQIRRFPEVDRAEFFDVQEAKKKINPAQVELIDRLQKYLSGKKTTASNL